MSNLSFAKWHAFEVRQPNNKNSKPVKHAYLYFCSMPCCLRLFTLQCWIDSKMWDDKTKSRRVAWGYLCFKSCHFPSWQPAPNKLLISIYWCTRVASVPPPWLWMQLTQTLHFNQASCFLKEEHLLLLNPPPPHSIPHHTHTNTHLLLVCCKSHNMNPQSAIGLIKSWLP